MFIRLVNVSSFRVNTNLIWEPFALKSVYRNGIPGIFNQAYQLHKIVYNFMFFLLYDMIRYHIMYHIWFNMIWYNIIIFYMRSCSIIQHNIMCYNVVMYHLILCIIWYCIMLCYVLCNQTIYNTVQYRIKFFNTISYL